MSVDTNNTIAILIADLHLSQHAPEARSGEPDWFRAMKRPLDELNGLAKKHNAPIICAGDIFHFWKSSPELINFALSNLPDMIAIPGQHDLPLHNYDNIEKSAYRTLVRAGKIEEAKTIEFHNFNLHCFPWGFPITPPETSQKLNVAIVHRYVWIRDKNYAQAPETSYLGYIEKELKGHNVVVFGDNHIPFSTTTKNGVKVWNCGSLMRRASDQIDHKPRVGLLQSDGSILTHYLDVSADKIHSTSQKPTRTDDEQAQLYRFLENLDELEEVNLDYLEILSRYVEQNEMDVTVKSTLWEVIEKCQQSKM